MTGAVAQPRSVSAVAVAGDRERLEPALGRPTLRQEAGFCLVLAGLVLSCFAGHWRDMGIPVPVDRGLLLTGLVLEWNRARRMGALPRPTAAAVLLVAAAMWTSVSFLGSAIRTSGGFYFLLDLFLLPTVLFVGGPMLFGTARRRFAFAAVFTVFGLYLGLTAIAESLHLVALVVPSYISDPAVGLHQDRARGPYVEAVNNGMMLIFSGVLATWVASTARSKRWRTIGSIAAALCGIGCALTLTRAIWIGGGVALLIALIAVPGLRRRLPLVLAGLVATAAVFLAVFPAFLDAATGRGEAQSPIYDRLDVAQGATSMALQNPLFGVGWNQAGLRMAEFVRLGADYPVTAASAGLIPHNVFLGRFAELGILGGCLWLASVVAAVFVPVLQRSVRGRGSWRLVLLVFALSWLIIANFGPVNYSEPQYLLFTVGGITASGRASLPTPWDWRPRPARPGRWSRRQRPHLAPVSPTGVTRGVRTDVHE